MSELKFFEIRDAATFMPVMAVRPVPKFDEERYLLERAGFGRDGFVEKYIMLIPLEKETWSWDAHHWESRTLVIAHEYIEEFWSQLPTGSVIDVEFILGLRDVPKQSERTEFPLSANES